MKVAILGTKWSFHEIAAEQYFSNEQWVKVVDKLNFDALLDSVVSWEADYWLVEVENTVTWSIYNNLNLLINKDVSIIWETYLKVEQNLSALPWVKIEDLKVVCSKYTAIEQSRKFFEKYPEIKLVECWDLSMVSEEIKKQNLTNVWIIWWKLEAKLFWFNILEEKLEGENKNYTRYFIIQAKSKVQNKEFNKASLHLLLPHQVWSLMKILWIIAAYEINLSKVESVPILWEPFKYSFFVDINFEDVERYKGMIVAIKPLLKELDILWEYQAFDKLAREK